VFANAAQQTVPAQQGWCADLRETAGGDARAKLPPLSGRVVDRADLLPAAAEGTLTQKLEALEQRTTDQLVVVTLESLGGCSIEQVGLLLGKGWGVGQKDKNNGVLLIAAPQERKVRIEVGLGLERRLTNEKAAGIINQDILPRFREGEMQQGIVKGVDAILAVLDPNVSPAGVPK